MSEYIELGLFRPEPKRDAPDSGASKPGSTRSDAPRPATTAPKASGPAPAGRPSTPRPADSPSRSVVPAARAATPEPRPTAPVPAPKPVEASQPVAAGSTPPPTSVMAPPQAAPAPTAEARPAATPAKDAAPDLRPTMMAFVHQLLDLLADTPIDSEGLGLSEFRESLEGFFGRLQAASDPSAWQAVSDACVAHTADFHRRLQAHLAERETEFADLVRVVEQLVTTMHGDGGKFDAQLAGSSDRLTRIVEIDDIRILKRRLSLELVTLRRVIDEQRQQHEEHRRQLATEVTQLQKRLDKVREEASLDGLTRIPNRARFDRTLRRWVSMHKQSGQKFVLALVDVDDFKQVNDTCGHPEGDRVLCEVASALRAQVRATDLVARYGGDEFVVLLAGADLHHAEQRMTTAIGKLKDIGIRALLSDGAPYTVSASSGVTEWTVHDSAAEVLARADRALYEAKANGKGQVRSMARPPKSRLFENGRPVVGANVSGVVASTSRKAG